MENRLDKEPKELRIPLMMEASLLEQIDQFRLTYKIWSRGEAIRKLVREGLQKEIPAPTGE